MAHVKATPASQQHPAGDEQARAVIRRIGMLDNIDDAVYVIDREWRFTYLNKAAELLFGRPRANLLGKEFREVYEAIFGLASRGQFERAFREQCGVVFEEFDTRLQSWLEVHIYPSQEGVGVSLRDISERKRAHEAIRESEERFKNVTMATMDAIWEWNARTNSHWWNENIQKLFGYMPEDFKGGIEAWTKRIHPEDKERVLREHRRTIDSGEEKWTDEYRFLRKDGSYAYVLDRAFVIRDSDGEVVRMVGAIADLTARKQAELDLARLNRALQMRSACNEILIRATDETQLLTDTCRLAVGIGGYSMAWVGYAQDNEQRTITPMAHAGVDAAASYLNSLQLSWHADQPIGRGPAGITIRSGQPVVLEDLEQEPMFAPWLEPVRQRGYRGIFCLPLRDKERTFGLLALYSSEVRPIAAEEKKLLQQLADDLAFGIGNLRAEEERRRIQSAVFKVAAGVSARTGTEFFEQLARNMVEAVGADAGAVARLLPGEPDTVRTIAAVIDGEVVDNFSYTLAGTPCEKLLLDDHWIMRTAVNQQFPAAPLLSAVGAADYAGGRLESSGGQPMGLLFVLFRKPLTRSHFIKPTLQIFASRAAAELERQAADARINDQASLLDKAKDAIVVTDIDHRVHFWNKGAERLYGWTSEEAGGRTTEELLGGDPGALQDATRRVLEHGEWTGELTERRKGGSTIAVEANWTLVRDEDGRPKSILAIKTDITQRNTARQKLLYMAQYDQLTDLPNRSLFHERLARCMARSRRSGRPMALMYLDVDCFKHINDSLGHNAGDEVLKGFAARLKASVREVDTVARLGGDEFTVLIEELQQEEDAQNIAAKIFRLMADPFRVASRDIRVTTSIGIAVYRGEDITDDKLVIRADKALYQAKNAGRNTYWIAAPETNTGERFETLRQPSVSEGDLPQHPKRHAAPAAAAPVPDRLVAGTALTASADRKATTTPAHARHSVAMNDFLQDSLAVIRTHLGMDVAFISEFINGERAVRHVSSAHAGNPVRVGDSEPLEQTYCLRVVDGRLPESIPDTHAVPAAVALPVTAALAIRSFAAVPIRLQDGRVYGTFCCFSHTPNHALNERELNMMRMFADLTARQIDKDRAADNAYEEMRARIESVLRNDRFGIVYQPIYDAERLTVVGYEALSRFSAEPPRSPDVWFAEAARVGLGAELEIRAIEKALQGLDALPATAYLSFNVSPGTITSGELERVLADAPFKRLVLEITEHSVIREYVKVEDRLRPLRRNGLRVAVDDAGAGYASFRHILELAPDLIKLDMSLTRNIDTSVACRALASALIRFAAETGSKIVAEGVETEAELRTLRELGIALAQGYLLGRPLPIDVAGR